MNSWKCTLHISGDLFASNPAASSFLVVEAFTCSGTCRGPECRGVALPGHFVRENRGCFCPAPGHNGFPILTKTLAFHLIRVRLFWLFRSVLTVVIRKKGFARGQVRPCYFLPPRNYLWRCRKRQFLWSASPSKQSVLHADIPCFVINYTLIRSKKPNYRTSTHAQIYQCLREDYRLTVYVCDLWPPAPRRAQIFAIRYRANINVVNELGRGRCVPTFRPSTATHPQIRRAGRNLFREDERRRELNSLSAAWISVRDPTSR